MGSSARYRIRVQGSIGPEWGERLGGLHCEVIPGDAGQAQTVLVGHLLDQAELSGVLNSLYDLRMPLLSLECLESWAGEESE